MFFLAKKNLFSEKFRFLLSVGGVAFSVLLIVVNLSFYNGVKEKVGLYVEEIDADLWVVQEGTRDFFFSTSLFPSELKAEIEDIEGVTKVDPILARLSESKVRGETVYTLIFGSEPGGAGGPSNIVDGVSVSGDAEIVLDRVYTNKLGLEVGDKVSLGDKEFEVVGISEGGNLVTFQLSFITFSEAKELFKTPDFTNFFLVAVEGDPGTVGEKIEEEIEDVRAFPKEDFAKNNRKVVEDGMLPFISVLIFVSFLVGVIVIGLTTYTDVLERLREYGILKAIGASNVTVYKIVFQQSLLTSVVGFILGVPLAYLVNYTASYIVPEFVTVIRWEDLLVIFAVTIGMGFISSFVPVRKLASLDPVDTFK